MSEPTSLKKYVDDLITIALDNLNIFAEVSALPTTNIKKNKIYVIQADEGYEYYIYTTRWRQLNEYEFDYSILEDYVLATDSRLSDARTPLAHVHDDRYYTETEMDTKLGLKANLTDIESVYATKEELNEVASGGADLTGYVTTDDARLSDARTPLTHNHLVEDITDFPIIPTRTSDLINDLGFLTSHQSLSNYVKTTDSRLSDARTPLAHSHAISDITNLQNTLNGKSDTGHTHSGYASSNHSHSYNSLTDIPSTFTPSSHSHSIGDVTNLQSTLNGKSDTSHGHGWTSLGSGCYYNEKISLMHVIGVQSGLTFNSDETKTLAQLSPVASRPPQNLVTCGSNRGDISCFLRTSGEVSAHSQDGHGSAIFVYYSFTYAVL